ncbi:protein-S-isoprenylcysteine methyltransferase [Desulfosporosinus sp. HMP52]|uniref:methyltransferase family protein n=1 Tax=Desulfosporosinus sp. HMP52 TaxID=1487923 RepID=UPI00051FB55C|nr:NnrU family protein [Desulfosporosinus sp. HMP52]KGK88117.1 protein-S-isoprenylcysteine methyltransferase [Desulfosporosinus sp. HMP52]
MKYLIISSIWSGFGIIHSALISLQFTNWAKRVMGRYFAFYRLGYNLLSISLFLVLFSITKSLDSDLILNFIPPWTILQLILLITSSVMIIWAFLSYDALEFVGIRQIMNINTKMNSARPQKITKKGLLGIVRHPMYLATIVFMWSLDSTRADVLVHLILTIYILIGIWLEERKLIREFGFAYIEYQRDVPALVPFLKKWK